MSLGEKHLAKRRKSRLSGFPTRESILKTSLDVLMYPVAIASPVALFPQVLQLYTTRDASSLSLVSWSVFVCLNVIWVLYGHVHRERPILITNAMLALLNSAVVIGIILYR